MNGSGINYHNWPMGMDLLYIHVDLVVVAVYYEQDGDATSQSQRKVRSLLGLDGRE